MAHIHMVLQGKGGVGKSMIAAIIAQYIRLKGRRPVCVDTDPVNATFHGYRRLRVSHLAIMEGEDIAPRRFDQLVEVIAGTTDQEDVIIDNGASSFVPLSSYLITNDVPALLHRMGHQLVVHTVITGGQALVDTVHGFAQLVKQFPDEAVFVVWLNPFWGAIELDGKAFHQMKAYTANKDRVKAIIDLPPLKEDTFGRDLSDMLQDRLTFEEAIAAPSRPIMVRQRLKIIQAQIFGQLAAVPVW